jgi:hypothetical protein
MAAIVGFLVMPRIGRAHTLGVSAASFDVEQDGSVEGRVTFATAEALSGIHLDRNHDGAIGADEVAAGSEDLKRFVLDGVDVTADAAPCPATFEGAAIDAIDGLVLRVRYQCPADAGRIAVTLYYLSALPREHRLVARIASGPLTTQAILSGDHRAIELDRPVRSKPPWLVFVLVGALAAAAIAVVALRRRRATS